MTMQRYLLFVIFFFLSCDVQAFFFLHRPVFGSRKNPILTPTINGVVDVNIRELQLIMRKYKMDPLNVQNISEKLGTGTLDLTSIKVCNLSTIRRTSDVFVLDNISSRNLSVDVSIGFAEIQILANYTAKTWLATSVGNLTGRLPGVNLALKLDFNFETAYLNLTSFTLSNNDKKMELVFNGDYQTIMNIFSLFITSYFEDVIISVIQGPMKAEIVKVVDQINAFLNNTSGKEE